MKIVLIIAIVCSSIGYVGGIVLFYIGSIYYGLSLMAFNGIALLLEAHLWQLLKEE